MLLLILLLFRDPLRDVLSDLQGTKVHLKRRDSRLVPQRDISVHAVETLSLLGVRKRVFEPTQALVAERDVVEEHRVRHDRVPADELRHRLRVLTGSELLRSAGKILLRTLHVFL